MNQQLTQEEIQHLYKVCENNGVSEYDVQNELVDHLALLIEDYWKDKPEDPFKYALYKAFQKFGTTGFKEVAEQKQKALTRKYNRLLWQYLLAFFRWPKILLTFALSLSVFLYLKSINELHWILVSYIGVLLIGVVVYDLRFKQRHKIKAVSGKTFLLLHQLKKVQSTALVLCNLPVFIYPIFSVSKAYNLSLPNNAYILFAIALVIVSLTMVLFGYFFYIPQKIKAHFFEQYAEFAM
jgi:hypothetical protein